MKSALLLLWLSSSALAQTAAEPAPMPVESLEPSAEAVSERYVGIHIALNVGLFAVDFQNDRLYGFFSGNFGIPILSNGKVASVVMGLGYNVAITRLGESTMAYMDFFGEVAPGWFSNGGNALNFNTDFYTAVGMGIGFRLLHRTGFTVGFKIPVLGLALGPGVSNLGGGGFTSQNSVGLYYLANLISLPIVSFGYRF